MNLEVWLKFQSNSNHTGK